MITLAVLAQFQIVGADKLLVAGAVGPFPSRLVGKLSRRCGTSGAAILAFVGESVQSQYARRILAQEGFEDREAAAKQSDIELNRTERKVS